MRAFLGVVSVAALSLSGTAQAQSQPPSPSVNQRMTTPTSQADTYVGVSLGQLIVALGMTLHGVPPHGLDEIRMIHPHQTAEAPRADPPAPAGVPGPGATMPGNMPPSP